MKILLIAGHGATDPGACSNYGIERTETRNVVAELVKCFSNYEVEVYVYPIDRNAYEDVKNGTVKVNFADYDYVFEIHFNSSSPNAYGVEVWVTPDESSTFVEQKVVDKISALGFANRGVKKEYFAVITSAKKKGTSSALVETCFISNKDDMDKYKAKFKEICSAIVDGIAQGFELKRKINNGEEDEVKGIVVYTYELDGHIARWLAYNLRYEVESASTKKDYSGYKEVICIGGNKNNYTSYCTKFISGSDRYETVKEVLKYLGKL